MLRRPEPKAYMLSDPRVDVRMIPLRNGLIVEGHRSADISGL